MEEFVIEDLSLHELVGQMMIIGIRGARLDRETEDLLYDVHPGGIILFRENYENYNQLKRFCSDIQGVARNWPHSIPLFISVDQEGGRVIRLPSPFSQVPSAREIGTKGPEYAYKIASLIARELRDVGITMDHAPVLDVDTNTANPVIGDRSFGDDPEMVAQIGIEFFKGLQDNSIISTGKHFPGHGDSEKDSHLTLPVVRHRKSQLEDIELYPFDRAIKQGIDTIMTAHVLYPSFDELYPATLSERIIRGILREQLGFCGVIISDDLSMKAITLKYDLDEACYMAICAGISIFLISHQPYSVYKNIQRNVVKKLSKDNNLIYRVKKEVESILALKKRYCA
ncbi:MAG: beta-N-acetylhexosaminidase [bacterium]